MARRRTNRSDRSAGPREVLLISRTALLVMSGASERELAVWEREDLIAPVEYVDRGGEPLYDRETLRRIRVIRTLADELEVNLPGIGVILNLLDQLGG